MNLIYLPAIFCQSSEENTFMSENVLSTRNTETVTSLSAFVLLLPVVFVLSEVKTLNMKIAILVNLQIYRV